MSRHRTTIRRLREKRELSREQLAVQSGLASGTVRLAELNGVTRLHVASLVKLAQGLDLDLEIYLGDTPLSLT